LICHKHEDKTYYFASEIQLNPQQMIALEHGFIIGLSKGKTGLVPYTDAPIIKIKSKGDKRIYAANKKISIQGELIEDNDIVENSKGAVLVIFTKIVKHKEMQRVVDELKGSKLKPALVKDSIEPKTSSNLFLAEDDLNLEYYHTDSHEYSTKTMGGNNEIFEN
jgi:hypothetical protein